MPKLDLNTTLSADPAGNESIPLQKILESSLFNANANTNVDAQALKAKLQGEGKIDLSLEESALLLGGARRSFVLGVVEQLENLLDPKDNG